MFSRLHNRLGTAGLAIAVVALVAALAGTAFAATRLNGTQKKEVRKIAKQFAGKNGAPGANGAAGANGKDGANGTNGTNGAPGAEGKSVEAEAAAPAKCAEGGTVFKIGGVEKGKACNGEEGPAGEPWTAGGTLPVGSTETGAWMFSGTYGGEGQARAQIPFTLPLTAALGESKVHLIQPNGKELFFNLAASPEPKTEEITASAACAGGSAANPKATSGNLCVYVGKALNPVEGFFGSNLITDPSKVCTGLFCQAEFGGPGAGSSVAGAIVSFEYETTGAKSDWGTWAVTG